MPGRGKALVARSVLVAALALAALPAQAEAARPGGKLVPERGVLLGAYLDRWGSQPFTNVTAFEADLGRKLDIDHRYWAWTDGWPYMGAAPYHHERWDVENGRIPMVSWDYVGAGSLDRILDGTHDAVIRARARKVAEFGHPLFVRWGYEMNGSWMPWSGYQNGKSAAKYKAAWRYLHDMFTAEGARNAVWVWAPNAQDNPAEAWNDFRNYYPGDAYVDWVGIDGYNWGTTESWSRWESFASVFGRVYSAYASRKPIMIAEVGSTELGGSKSQWILRTAAAVRDRFPSIAAFVYFNENHGGYDWKLSTSASAFAAFKTLAADPHFDPSAPPVARLPGTIAVRARTARPKILRRTVVRVNDLRVCSAPRVPTRCKLKTGAGKHAVLIRVATRAGAARRMSFRLSLSGYSARSVVFKLGKRVACVDRRAPFRCRAKVRRGRSMLRIRFVGRTSAPRATLARVRVIR